MSNSGFNYSIPCDVIADCLECPLSVCRHDAQGPYADWAWVQTNPWVLEVEREYVNGASMKEISSKFGITQKRASNEMARLSRIRRTETWLQ